MRAAWTLDSLAEAMAALLLRETRLRAVTNSNIAAVNTRINTKPDSSDPAALGRRMRAIGLG